MIMKRSIACMRYIKALVLLTFCVLAPKAAACGWDATDNYYLFYAFSGDRTNTAAIRTGLTQWWTEYAGTVITTDDLDALNEEIPARLSASKNPIVRAAYRKGDKAMQQYLRLLCEYLAAAPSGEYDPWDYPDAEELAAQRANMLSVARRSAQAAPGNHRAQFLLLRIRALFQGQQWQDVVKLWRQEGGRLQQSVFKDMAAGFYAGALRKLGSDEDAAEIYASLGDLHSATWCVHDGRNLGTIRRLYKQNPNSQAVRLLVQDFVNNTQETLDNADGFARLGHDGYMSKVYAEEVAQFALFALQAAENPAVEDPCMWLTAAAWTSYLYGDKVTGNNLIDQAMVANGTPQMKDCARVIRIVIRSGLVDEAEEFDAFVLPELQWLTQQVKYSEVGGFNHFFNASQRVFLRHLAPYYWQQGRSTDALLCIAEAEKMYSRAGEEDLMPHQVLYHWDYTSELLGMDAKALLSLYKDLYQSPMKPLRQWLYSELHPALRQTDLYTDLIGTRLMKEGDFKAALPWLKKVSTDFLSAQDISYYMARRDYTRERWLEERQTLPEVCDGFGGEEPTRLTSNQRLDYCQDVLALQQQVETATTDAERASAHYALATLLYQGSMQGDCWYLTEYYRSSEPPAVLLDTMAHSHLCQAAERSKGVNLDLYTRTLMGMAFINLDATSWNGYQFFSYHYDWTTERYTLEFHPDASRQQCRDFYALASHVQTLPQGYQPDFITRCDVLQTWLARNQ